jgi:hypothetical protein
MSALNLHCNFSYSVLIKNLTFKIGMLNEKGFKIKKILKLCLMTCCTLTRAFTLNFFWLNYAGLTGSPDKV